MARSWHYPAWRRIVMQVTLCVILAATLGLAMLVSHRKLAVKLTRLRWADNVGAQLPSGWMLEEENSHPPVLFQIREPGLDHAGRLMTIRSEQQPMGTSTFKYLKEGSLLQGTMEVLGADEPIPITLAGVPGLLVQRKRAMVQPDGDAPPMDQSVWFAAGVMPSGQAISIELACPVEIDAEADKTVVINTAAGISVNGNLPATGP